MGTENKLDSCTNQNDTTENVETAETPLVQQPKIETIVKIKSEDSPNNLSK